jgi:hypothetical protein
VQEVRQQIETTSMSDFTNLDAQLREILTSSAYRTIDDSTKVKIMNGILQRFVEANRIMRQPFQFPVPAAAGGEEASPLTRQRFPNWDTIVRDVERTATKKFAVRARKLIERLMEVDELAWNGRGEVIIADKLIPASNIVTLVVDAAKTPNKHVPPPTGWVEFGQLMERNNISTLLIGNQARYYSLFAPYYSFNARDRPPSESGSTDDEGEPNEEVATTSAAAMRRSARTAAAAAATAAKGTVGIPRGHPLNWVFNPDAPSSFSPREVPLVAPDRPRKGAKLTATGKRPAPGSRKKN